MTGYCFIRLCHLASTIHYRDTNSMRVLRFRELLDVVREYDNCINLSRAATNYINLGGNEPVSSRPPKGRVQKFMLGKLVDFSIKWVGGVSLVH